jgi:hypothetical protein
MHLGAAVRAGRDVGRLFLRKVRVLNRADADGTWYPAYRLWCSGDTLAGDRRRCWQRDGHPLPAWTSPSPWRDCVESITRRCRPSCRGDRRCSSFSLPQIDGSRNATAWQTIACLTLSEEASHGTKYRFGRHDPGELAGLALCSNSDIRSRARTPKPVTSDRARRRV